MRLVRLEYIKIKENRWRKTVKKEAVIDLAESIANLGLFHAPVVENDERTIIMGETRYNAIKYLSEKSIGFIYGTEQVDPGYIPVIVVGKDLSPHTLKEMELDENIVRTSLTWMEKAHATSELHEHRQGEKAETGEEQTLSETAKEIRGEDFTLAAIADVRDDLIIVAFDTDEDVVKAPTRKEALKVIDRKLKEAHRAQLAKEFELSKLSNSHEMMKGDLRKLLPKYKVNTFDCIIADPPYGIDADTFRNQNAVEHGYADNVEYADEIMRCIAKEGWRTTKLRAHAYIFCDINRFSDVKRIFESEEWYVWATPLIWYRGHTSGLLPRPEHGPRRTYEAIAFCIKNDRKTKVVGADVLLHDSDRKVTYGAHKPVELYEDLIRRSCNPGDVVLDPCCGSGPIFPAAEKLQVIAHGFDNKEEAYAYSVARLRDIEEGIL